jgi:SAM-dependent methyltransferase
MNQTKSTSEKAAYCQAANTGKYEKPSGLLGKYDNTRRFWEDRATTRFLAASLNELVARRTDAGLGLNVMDLGCGAGDGIDLLRGIDAIDVGLGSSNHILLNERTLDRYVGLDLNEDLLEQARTYHGDDLKLQFMQGDLSDGLPRHCAALKPFDLYFAGYGTLSHFHDDQAVKIIADICCHAAPGAIFVGDWLGRYSYEWLDLWDNSTDRELFMEYRISYIYDEKDRPLTDICSFPLRLMSREEIMSIIRRAEADSGVEITPLSFFDKSVLIGRHMDTGEYNQHCPKIRFKVNSLFEHNTRTDLDSLLFEYYPRGGFDWQNEFLSSFFSECNLLIAATQGMLHGVKPHLDQHASLALKEALEAMSQTIDTARGLGEFADWRANLIEPTLAYCLRKLEMELQPGKGTGHGIVGVFRIDK